jgi:hypothetical protein
MSGVEEKQLVYGNFHEPWSAFICGVQGSGKSHSLATLLENCILTDNMYGAVPNPLTAMAFQYDSFSGYKSTQICELAYFCSAGIQVKVLVAPDNYREMRRHYENLPNLPAGAKKPKVYPMRLSKHQLNAENVLTLMSFNRGLSTPLYQKVLSKVLRRLKMEQSPINPSIDLQVLRRELTRERLNNGQDAMLQMRLDLIEEFASPRSEDLETQKLWKFTPGSLTIVDLSSEFVDKEFACTLFSIVCASSWLNDVMLDE